MSAEHDLIERGIPDLTDSARLGPVVAAEVDFLAGRHASWIEEGESMVRARACVLAGDEASATSLLEAADLTACTGQELTAAAWSVSRIGSRPMAEALLEALRAQPSFLVEGDVPLGPRALATGPLLASTGDLHAAADVLREAVVAGDARAPLWGALARAELARVMLCAEVVGDPAPTGAGQTVDQLITAAGLFFRAGGYRALLARTADLTHPDGGVTVPLGAPMVGRLRPGPTWQVGFGVMGDVTLRASKGLGSIRHLVSHPGQPVPAAELDRLARGGEPDESLGRETIGDDASVAEIRDRLFDESVRSRVGKLIARTISRLEDDHPLLGRHLHTTVRTGHRCRYDPPADRRVIWID
ncbi:MAG: hypothetical protein RIB98_19205 [Acidimicrobiales bacterium]